MALHQHPQQFESAVEADRCTVCGTCSAGRPSLRTRTFCEVLESLLERGMQQDHPAIRAMMNLQQQVDDDTTELIFAMGG